MKTLLTLCVLAVGCDDDSAMMESPDLAMQIVVDMSVKQTGDAATIAAVDVIDNMYAPRNVTISQGGTVTWTWRGSSQHSVTSDDNGATFDSGKQTTGTFMHTFPAPGSFPYHCEVHGALMAGTITVQ